MKATRLGEFIRRGLEDREMSRYAFAKKMGTSEGYLHHLEKDERKPEPGTL